MRLLTLVRHAKSSWADAELSDFERPLNERGRRDAPRMAAHLRERIGIPDRLISSPALRAITTARVFAAHFGIADDAVQHDARIYEATPDTLLRIVNELEDEDQHVMLFGHNPGFSELAHRLATCPFDQMPTCAAAHLALPIEHWWEIAPRCGALRDYRYPKALHE